MRIQCPVCRSYRIVAREVGKKAGGLIGLLGGAAGGAASTLGGAKSAVPSVRFSPVHPA
jgi:hypothetical protein